VNLYALIGRMRILSSQRVVDGAERVVGVIIETYRAANKTFGDVVEIIDDKTMDPLRDFGEACRRSCAANACRARSQPKRTRRASDDPGKLPLRARPIRVRARRHAGGHVPLLALPEGLGHGVERGDRRSGDRPPVDRRRRAPARLHQAEWMEDDLLRRVRLAAAADDPRGGGVLGSGRTPRRRSGLGIGGHIFVGSKAPWDEIAGDAPRFTEGPAGPRAEEAFR
jgi:hypothetical protein